MQSAKTVWTVICLALALTLGYVAARRSGPESQSPTLRTYTVPAARAPEIKDTLNRMFTADKTEGGAQLLGNGLLVVRASESYQSGVARLVDQVASLKDGSLHTIRFDYWLVRSEPAKESNVKSIPALSAALEGIEQAQGPQKFALLEHLTFNTLDRRETTLRGSIAEVQSITKEGDGALDLNLTIKTHGLGELKVNTQAKPGEILVLGENTSPAEGNGPLRQVYHIVRAEIAR